MATLDIIARFQNQASAEAKALKKDIAGIDDQAQKTTKSTKSLTESWAKFAVGAAAVIAVGKKVFDFQKENIRLAGIQEDAERQLTNVIQSTGGAAGLTATELKGMASELQGVTKFGDEATIQGQNLLLTFTNIGKDVFPKATETMLDMSQALGQDMKSSAIQLGKALNDPIAGITALSRVGVSFTAQQKEQIAVLVESGRTMEAQNIILNELSREFGGSAAAAAETHTGQIVQLDNAYGDLREQLGFYLRLSNEQVGATKGVVEAVTANLSLQNRLNQEVAMGNITWDESQRILREVAFTGKTTAEALTELDEQQIVAEQSAMELNTRVHDMNQRFQDQAVMAAAAKDEIILWHQEAAIAAGVNDDLADKLAQVNNKLTEEETALVVAQQKVDALSEAAGNGAIQNAGYSGSLDRVTGSAGNASGEVQSLSSRLAGLPSSITTKYDFQAFGIDTLEKANRLLASLQGFQSGPGGADPYGGQTPGQTSGTPGDPYTGATGEAIDQGIAPTGPGGTSGTGSGSGAALPPRYAMGTNGWETVPGPTGRPYPVILHGGENFNVRPPGEQAGGTVNNFNIEANYGFQSERALRDDIQLLQMLGS